MELAPAEAIPQMMQDGRIDHALVVFRPALVAPVRRKRCAGGLSRPAITSGPTPEECPWRSSLSRQNDWRVVLRHRSCRTRKSAGQSDRYGTRKAGYRAESETGPRCRRPRRAFPDRSRWGGSSWCMLPVRETDLAGPLPGQLEPRRGTLGVGMRILDANAGHVTGLGQSECDLGIDAGDVRRRSLPAQQGDGSRMERQGSFPKGGVVAEGTEGTEPSLAEQREEPIHFILVRVEKRGIPLDDLERR